ncbi:MAG TPA: response regulator [Stellaceae bacterium]|nr:response regulator [Stellaceae bacterium]
MKKILIIDDNDAVRSTMARILDLAGYETVTAGDGNEGLARMRAERPDLIITDIIMPEKEGIETIRSILAEQPDAKIVAVSGGGRHGTLDFLSAARKLGAAEVLQKPFEPDELVTSVARCLDAA